VADRRRLMVAFRVHFLSRVVLTVPITNLLLWLPSCSLSESPKLQADPSSDAQADAKGSGDAGPDAPDDGSTGELEASDGCARNACGGCGVLTNEPGATCGTCGKYVCDAGGTSVSCDDPGYATVRAISTGRSHTCAALSSGTVRCWGDNRVGQLGDGTETNRSEPVPVNGLTEVVSVSAGNDHTCALLASGEVRCWGYAPVQSSKIPVVIQGVGKAEAISVGSYACALVSGAVRCWGESLYGLGDGTTDRSATAVAVSGIGNATAISVGDDYACAVVGRTGSAPGEARCWGYNDSGQLGNGTTTYSPVPVPVGTIVAPQSISAGGLHTCSFLPGTGQLSCWGNNSTRQLGVTTTGTKNSTPIPVFSNVRGVDTGGGHTCAMLGNGSVQCWGWNSLGQVGNGTTGQTANPVTITSMQGAVAIGVGSVHTCAVMPGGIAHCWGSNEHGQLGTGGVADQRSPTRVQGLERICL
jgi:alpha-tubulin suppressor-like RCC1 family protein